MNNERRNKIKKIMSMLQDAKTELGIVFDEEQDAYDNLPENLQCTMRASNIEDAISDISDAMDTIDEVLDILGGVV